MREKSLMVICATVIICVFMICGTVLLISNQSLNDSTVNNNFTLNSSINETNNTTVNTTAQTSSSSESSNKKSSTSSSISSQATGDNVPTYDSNGNRIFRDGVWVGYGPGGAHIYKDPSNGQLFDSSGNLPSDYEYTPK